MEKAKGRILAPVDLSAASEASGRYALEIARELDAEVVFLYVQPENSLSSMILFPKFFLESDENGWNESKKEKALAKLVAFLNPLGLHGVRYETRVERGSPYAEIQKVVEEIKPDVVVQGTHGSKGMEDRIIGGTAESMISKTKCPVLSVKPLDFGPFLRKSGAGVGLFEGLSEALAGPRESYRFPPKRVLYATDFSEAARLAMGPALNAARLCGSELIVLHLSKKDPDEPGGGKEDGAEEGKGPTAREQMETLLTEMSAYDPALSIRSSILREDSRSSIVSFAVHEDVDLVVMGTRGLRGWELMLTGSTALHVVHHAPCPVLTVRPNWKLEEAEKKFSRVYRRLGAADLQRMSDEHQALIDEDLLGMPGEIKKSEFFLNAYSREGMLTGFEEYGILDRLRKRGFDGFRIGFDLGDPYRHRMRLYYGDVEEPDHLLIELVLREGTCQLPAGIGEGENDPFLVLIIEWILMQNPRDPFSPDRPPLPGQEFPGLGAGYEVYESLVRMGMRGKKEGLMNRPQHYHNAKLYHERFKFMDPVREGRLVALMRDTGEYNLADVSWATYRGCLLDAETDAVVQWDGGIMLCPMVERLEKYYSSADYHDTLWDTVGNSRYRIDWDLFRKRMESDEDPTTRVRATWISGDSA